MRARPTRAFATVPEGLRLSLDEAGKATLRLSLPLSSLSPPVRRDDLAGLSARIPAPVGTRATWPFTVEERNGQAVLTLEAEVHDDALIGQPLVLVLGDASLLLQHDPQGAEIYSGALSVQVSTPALQVDLRAPALRDLQTRHQQLSQRLDAAQAERQQLAAGTSSWFASRQVEDELSHARTRLDAARAARSPVFESALARWRGTPALQLADASSHAVEPAVGQAWRTALIAAHNAELELPDARASRQVALDAGALELVARDDARVTALEATVAAGAKAEAELRATFDGLELAAQGRWLGDLAETHHWPEAASLRAVVKAEVDASIDVHLVEEELARVRARQQTARPEALAAADEKVSGLRAELTTTAARMKQLAQGTPVVERYPTRYAPDLVVI